GPARMGGKLESAGNLDRVVRAHAAGRHDVFVAGRPVAREDLACQLKLRSRAPAQTTAPRNREIHLAPNRQRVFLDADVAIAPRHGREGEGATQLTDDPDRDTESGERQLRPLTGG